MPVIIIGWMLLCVAAALMLATALIMLRLGSYFITRDVLVREFSMLDLELASSEMEIDNTLTGITKLDPAVSARVIRSLKSQLYVDFVFMPAAYGAIFIICMKVAHKMPEPGLTFFGVLAWMQVIAWICDILENIYLLQKINRLPEKKGGTVIGFPAYQYLEAVKWGLALLGVVCASSALLYFWVSGLYRRESLGYLLTIMLEALVFALLAGRIKKAGKAWQTSAG